MTSKAWNLGKSMHWADGSGFCCENKAMDKQNHVSHAFLLIDLL